jgi:hypothetical protein
MKTVKGFLKSLRVKPIYDGFSDAEDVFAQFQKAVDSDIQFLYAFYSYEDYDGNAAVLYYRKSTKKYYEAYGGHCSCYGLEGQWEGDEEIVVEELFKRFAVLNAMFEEYKRK